jgi:hypothetical protein
MSLGKAAGLLLLTMMILPGPARGQTSMGTVNGTVTDPTGAVVPGATVTLVNQGTNVQNARQTNDAGYFVFVNVRPGSYLLTVELSGFTKVEVSAFNVGVNETVARNVKLELGAVTETTVVTGQSELIQTSTAELGNVVEEAVISAVPLQGRNFTQLMLLSPGVNPVSTAQGPQSEIGFGAAEGSSGVPFSAVANASVQGQQNRSKIYYVDGIVNTSVRSGSYVALPDIDSLQEFKVQSHSDKAEFGGVTGGVINMTSKSGTNRFGGSAFGFLRDESFSARNPFRDVVAGRAVEHPVFDQSQFGANLGGPIWKDKTFFFASYDGWRYKDVSDVRLTVPTTRELGGDFSQAFHGRQIYNPYTTRVVNGQLVRDPFPGNVIPSSLISPTMRAFLQAYMVTAAAGGSNNFIDQRDRTARANTFQVRVDHHFSPSDNVFFRWTEQRLESVNPIGDRGERSPESTNRNFGGGWFHTFSPSVILEVRGGVATQPTEDAPLEHELGVAPQQALGLPQLDRFFGYFLQGGNNNNFQPWNIPDLGVQGPRPRNNPNWNAAADLTWLRGNHNFKLGFQMLQISRLQRNQFGQLNFHPEATQDPQNPARTGDALASALLGLHSRIQGNVPDQGFIDFHTSTLSGYLQDQWAIRPNLTVTYGLRYDYITRATGEGLQSGPDFDTGEWLIALPELPPVCSSVGNAPPCLPAPLSQIPSSQFIRATGERFSILKPIKDNIGPRLGVAWQMNPRTVLRSGYSLMWDSMVSRSQYGQHQFETWGWPQFSGIDTGVVNRPGMPLQSVEDISSLAFNLPAAQPWNASGWFNDPDRKNAYSHQWHVEVQREVTRNLMVGLAYVGSYNGRMEYSGYKQAATRPGVDPATGRRLLPAEVDQLRPWPHITGTFRYSDDIGMSRYNALQVKVQRRFANGLGSMLSYTWSRSVDTSSGWFNTENGIGGGTAVQNYHDIDDARGISGYDIPHLLTWATVWELPFGRGKRWLNAGPASWLLGNWQLNWMLLARSGQPFTPTVPGDPANIGITNYARPNLVGDPTVANPSAEMWFDPAAFAVPNLEFGNAERNLLRAPSLWNVDLGVQRNLPLGEGRSLQLRVEAFNVFNHINLGNPEVNITLPTAGRITSMSGRPRQLQFGVRLVY